MNGYDGLLFPHHILRFHPLVELFGGDKAERDCRIARRYSVCDVLKNICGDLPGSIHNLGEFWTKGQARLFRLNGPVLQ